MPVRQPKEGQYRWSNVRDTGRLLCFRCGVCRRRMFFDPADLIEVFGNRDWQDCPFPCSKCQSRLAVDVSMYYPEPGDYGRLRIRRPGRLRKIRTWRTVRLGD